LNELETELKSEFLDAAEQLVLNNESCFLKLEESGLEPRIVNRMFQLTHSLKRAAGAVGFREVSSFTHELQQFLEKIRGKNLRQHAVLVSILLRCNERIYYMLDQLKQNLNAQFDNSDLVQELNNFPLEEWAEGVVSIPEELSKVTTQQLAQLPFPSLAKLIEAVDKLLVLRVLLRQRQIDSESAVIREKFAQYEAITKKVENLARSLDLVPLAEPLERIKKLITDSAQNFNRKISFTLTGTEIPIDRTTLDQVWGLLLQWIGFIAFQSTKDTISLAVSTHDERILFEVQESGQCRYGIRGDAWVAEMKARARKHQCDFKVISQGAGSLLQLFVPAHLSAIHGMVVVVGGEKLVIPAAFITESIRLGEDTNGEFLARNGESIPVFPLARLFGRRVFHRTPSQSTALIIQCTSGKLFALLVDEVLGPQEMTVSKMTGATFETTGVTGNALLETGAFALVLDFDELLQGVSSISSNKNLSTAA
jgi:chemotaxis protein histidine kinase CheA